MSCMLYSSLYPWTATNAMQTRKKQQAVDLLIFWQSRRRKKTIKKKKKKKVWSKCSKTYGKHIWKRRREGVCRRTWVDKERMNGSMRKQKTLAGMSPSLSLSSLIQLTWFSCNSTNNDKVAEKKRIILTRRGLFDL